MPKAFIFFITGWFLTGFGAAAMAAGPPLLLSTDTQVDAGGRVRVHLTVKNTGREPLHDIRPMFHFHHTTARMSAIVRLDPGQAITLENADHPPVLRSGRYPLVVMAQYQTDPAREAPLTQVHTGSFYFREPVESVIAGEIHSTLRGEESLLQIFIRNPSASFKNVRLMLLLPPGLVADRFGRMMGFTLRGGEEKMFHVPVRRVAGSAEAVYPVHLMVEYAEMLKHYTGEIGGEIDFRSALDRTALVPHAGATLVLMLIILYAQRKRAGSTPS